MKRIMINLSRKIALSLTLLFTLVSCNEPSQNKTLTILPVYQGQPISCDTGLTIQGKEWSIDQFHLYVHGVEFTEANEKWRALELSENTYQHQQVVLLGMDCANDDQGYWQLETEKPETIAAFNKLRFTVGVPFQLNHQNPLTQSSPLNVPNMFWVWQTGHKFIRLEMAAKYDSWLFHLGSTGCQSVSALRSPQSPCRYPNTAQMELAANKDGYWLLDITPWLADVNVTKASSCQSGHDDDSCRQLFDNLSIDSNRQELLP